MSANTESTLVAVEIPGAHSELESQGNAPTLAPTLYPLEAGSAPDVPCTESAYVADWVI